MHLRSPLRGIDQKALDGIIEPVLHAHGAELVDVEWKGDGGTSWVLRVFVEKAGAQAGHLSVKDAAVTLELCADVARDLSPALDIADIIPHGYNLEVSSPGVERPLRGIDDFHRFAAEKIKLRLRTPVEGEKAVIGFITVESGDGVSASEAVLVVRDGGREVRVPSEAVESARLVFEFGPTPRRGKGKSAAKAASPKAVRG